MCKPEQECKLTGNELVWQCPQCLRCYTREMALGGTQPRTKTPCVNCATPIIACPECHHGMELLELDTALARFNLKRPDEYDFARACHPHWFEDEED